MLTDIPYNDGEKLSTKVVYLVVLFDPCTEKALILFMLIGNDTNTEFNISICELKNN